MLKFVTLKNFRGFAEHKIEFGPESILVGKNNAGKTTVIEALRILSVFQVRAQTATFQKCPEWLDGFCNGAGFRASLETIGFDYSNVQHAYDSSKPAQIRAKLTNNNEIHIYIGKDQSEVFCQLRKGRNAIIHRRSDITPNMFGKTRVMPPVGSLLPNEKRIAKDRLKRFLDGYLAYRHFRNQLWEMPSDYRKFVSLLEASWAGLKIQHFEDDHGPLQNEFSMLVREGRFTSEISWHGHGLQAWMQTVWFLCRVDKSSTIVLDEPDVYLHADLQRKLIKMIESLNFRQAIVATHSSEIISDVPFQNVVAIQKRTAISKSAEHANEIQASLRSMGSIHNIQLSKLSQSGLILLVEGQDRLFLSEIAYKIGTKEFDRFSEIVIQEIEGKGNWQRALGAAGTIKEISGNEVRVKLLLDADYMLDQEKCKMLGESKKSNLDLKIWKKKEIENYLIIPEAILRYVKSRTKSTETIELNMIQDLVASAVEKRKDDMETSYADVIRMKDPRTNVKTAMRDARKLIDTKLEAGSKLSYLICGKEMLSQISISTQEKYGVNFSAHALCKEAHLSEFDPELVDYVRTLCAPV